MTAIEPSIEQTTRDGSLILTARGDWTAPFADRLEALVDANLAAGARALRIDVSSVARLDTFGAWSLERLLRSTGRGDALDGVPARNRGLVDKMHRVNRTDDEGKPRQGLTDRLEQIGRAIFTFGHDLLGVIAMLGALATTFVGAFVRPSAFRIKSVVHHLDRVGVRAVPIIALITFLIGCIIAQQGFFHFRKFGAEDYVVDLVAVLVLREIGVLLVTIMVAGRSGSSYTAEIGSMKMREEIDALRTMGLDPTEVLILPRVLALVIAVPMLTFIGAMAALYGGGLVAWLYADMSPTIFISRLAESVSMTDFKVGMIKAPFMALIVGAIASHEGLKVRGSAESLGLQTTTSVVKSIFLVIVLDGFFAIFFASIGM